MLNAISCAAISCVRFQIAAAASYLPTYLPTWLTYLVTYLIYHIYLTTTLYQLLPNTITIIVPAANSYSYINKQQQQQQQQQQQHHQQKQQHQGKQS